MIISEKSMKNNKLLYPMMTSWFFSPITSASESNYDYDEFTFGINASSLSTTGIAHYSPSNLLSEKLYLTFDLNQRSPIYGSTSLDPFGQVPPLSSAEIGFGVYQRISDKTEVYGALSFSKTWSNTLKTRFDSLSLVTGSITNVTENFQLITSHKFSKKFNFQRGYRNQNYQRKKGIEITGKLKLKHKIFITTGMSSSKGFPYLGVSFR